MHYARTVLLPSPTACRSHVAPHQAIIGPDAEKRMARSQSNKAGQNGASGDRKIIWRRTKNQSKPNDLSFGLD